MAPDNPLTDTLDTHLVAALDATEDPAARFHLRQAMQLCVVAEATEEERGTAERRQRA